MRVCVCLGVYVCVWVCACFEIQLTHGPAPQRACVPRSLTRCRRWTRLLPPSDAGPVSSAARTESASHQAPQTYPANNAVTMSPNNAQYSAPQI